MTRVRNFDGVGKKRRDGGLSSLVVSLLVSSMLLAGCSKSASDYLTDGKVALDKGDLSAAVIEFKNAVQSDPGSNTARLALAEALERNGDLQGAEQQCRRVLEQGGDADQLVPRIAVLLLDRGENALLIRDFATKELKSVTADSDLRALVALAYVGMGQIRDASTQVEKAKQQTAAVSLAQAQIDLSAGRRLDAAGRLDRILTDGNAPWWVTRAASRVFLANGDRVRALDAIKRSYDAAPKHRGVVGEYAELLIASNRRADARPLLDVLRKIAPTYYRTQYLDALFLMEDGKLDQAYTAATKVLAGLPKHIPSQLIAAKIELDRNELASVENRLKKIQMADPDLLEGYRLRAELEMRRGDIAAASTALGKAIHRAPDDRGLLAMAADVSWQKGDKISAISQLKRAAEMDPPRAELFARLAEMLDGAGKSDDAVNALSRAIETAQDNRSRDAVFNTAIRMKQLGRAKAVADAEVARRPKDAEPLFWQAVVLGMSGDAAGAHAQTLKALDLQPDFYPALRGLSLTVNLPGHSEEYANRLQAAVDLGSHDSRIYLDRIRQMRRDGTDLGRVRQVFDKALMANPGDISLREAAIQFWLTQGNKDKLLSIAKEGEATQPSNPEMVALGAMANEAAGNLEQAASQYSKLAAQFPERLDWNMKAADVLVRLGKRVDAINILKRLVNLRPDESAPYIRLAQLQVAQGQVKDAEVTAGILKDRPKLRGAGALLLGDVFAQTDRKADAAKAYAEASKAGAEEASLMHRVEQLLDKSNRQSAASEELESWLSVHPKSLAVLAFAARREASYNRHAEAAKHFEALRRLVPTDPVVANELAWSYLQTGDARALAVAKQAAAEAPDNPFILDTLGVALLASGNATEAVGALSRAKALAPKVPSITLNLADALLALGKKSDAASGLKEIDASQLDSQGQKRLQTLKGKL